MSNKEVTLLKKKVVDLTSAIEIDWRPQIKSASEKLVVLNKEAEELKSAKVENAQLEKKLEEDGLEKTKNEREVLQKKLLKLKEETTSGRNMHMI